MNFIFPYWEEKSQLTFIFFRGVGIPPTRYRWYPNFSRQMNHQLQPSCGPSRVVRDVTLAMAQSRRIIRILTDGGVRSLTTVPRIGHAVYLQSVAAIAVAGSFFSGAMEVSYATPIAGWFISIYFKENPNLKMDEKWGTPILGTTNIYIYWRLFKYWLNPWLVLNSQQDNEECVLHWKPLEEWFLF